MKHLLNNLTEVEKNAIREQHTGGMRLSNEKFSKLINSRLGDVRTLVKEEDEGMEMSSGINVNDILDLGYKFVLENCPEGPKNKEKYMESINELDRLFSYVIRNLKGNVSGSDSGSSMIETKKETKESFWDLNFGKASVDDARDSSMRRSGTSSTGRDDQNYGSKPSKENFYIVFDGQKYYEDDIEYADYQDMGDLPRVEDGKLIVGNPAWRL
jgi:hypothetical protein